MTGKTKPDVETYIKEKANCKERCKCRTCYEEYVSDEDPPSISYDEFQNLWVAEKEAAAKKAKAEAQKKADEEAAKQKAKQEKQPSKVEANNK